MGIELKIVPPLGQEDIKRCNDCNLNSPKAISWGNIKARTMFIATNPTQSIKEDRLCYQSKSFVALFKAMKELKKDSKDFYYTNIIRCATPDNRKPNSQEIRNCSRFIYREIEIIQPKRIICLGKTAGSKWNLEKFYVGKDLGWNGDITVFLFPHPAYIMRFPKHYERFKTYLGYILR